MDILKSPGNYDADLTPPFTMDDYGAPTSQHQAAPRSQQQAAAPGAIKLRPLQRKERVNLYQEADVEGEEEDYQQDDAEVEPGDDVEENEVGDEDGEEDEESQEVEIDESTLLGHEFKENDRGYNVSGQKRKEKIRDELLALAKKDAKKGDITPAKRREEASKMLALLSNGAYYSLHRDDRKRVDAMRAVLVSPKGDAYSDAAEIERLLEGELKDGKKVISGHLSAEGQVLTMMAMVAEIAMSADWYHRHGEMGQRDHLLALINLGGGTAQVGPAARKLIQKVLGETEHVNPDEAGEDAIPAGANVSDIIEEQWEQEQEEQRQRHKEQVQAHLAREKKNGEQVDQDEILKAAARLLLGKQVAQGSQGDVQGQTSRQNGRKQPAEDKREDQQDNQRRTGQHEQQQQEQPLTPQQDLGRRMRELTEFVAIYGQDIHDNALSEEQLAALNEAIHLAALRRVQVYGEPYDVAADWIMNKIGISKAVPVDHVQRARAAKRNSAANNDNSADADSQEHDAVDAGEVRVVESDPRQEFINFLTPYADRIRRRGPREGYDDMRDALILQGRNMTSLNEAEVIRIVDGILDPAREHYQKMRKSHETAIHLAEQLAGPGQVPNAQHYNQVLLNDFNLQDEEIRQQAVAQLIQERAEMSRSRKPA